MNFNLGRNWDMKGNLGQWWNALAASVLTGTDGLGAYLGEEGLTLVQVRKSLSGIQVGRWGTYPFELREDGRVGPRP